MLICLKGEPLNRVMKDLPLVNKVALAFHKGFREQSKKERVAEKRSKIEGIYSL
ncbi:hypothetical protein GCM10011362_27160 [Marinobacter halophilus]|nr:hypothetical protein GCM10011362_27160 [Marinobacter halophilus]